MTNEELGSKVNQRIKKAKKDLISVAREVPYGRSEDTMRRLASAVKEYEALEYSLKHELGIYLD